MLVAYWRSTDWRFAWAASLALLAIELGVVWVLLWQNDWQRRLFEAFERRDGAGFASLLGVFVLIAVTQIGCIIAARYLRQIIGLRWRGFLTRRYVERWTRGDRYAAIERAGAIDNPDQRIADDLRYISTGVLILVIEAIARTVSAVSFMMVLWRTSRPLTLELAGYRAVLSGDTIWAAATYALVGSAAMVWIGRPYIRRVQQQQHREGDFRAGLVGLRHDAAAVVDAGATGAMVARLEERFSAVQFNQRRLILASLGLTAGRSIYERIGAILPLFIVAPRYFASEMSFGDVMATRDAFWRLITDLSFFVQVYPQIAEQIANINRVVALDRAIGDAPALTPAAS